MGDKHLLICRDCRTFEWLELYGFPNFMKEHIGHKFMMVDDEAIGEVGAFDAFLKDLLDLFAE